MLGTQEVNGYNVSWVCSPQGAAVELVTLVMVNLKG